MRRRVAWLAGNQWSWAAAGSVILWLVACLLAHHLSLGLLLINCTLAAFLVLVGLGQMVVITSGDGSMDLSLPYVVTLSAFVSGMIMNNSNGRLLIGIVAGLGASIGMGVVNGFIVAVLKVPAMIGTLATGYMAYSVALQLSETTQGFPSPVLKTFALAHFAGGLSAVTLLTVFLCLVMFVVLARSTFGSYLEAMGQGRRAARLAGVPVTHMIFGNFVLSAFMGGVAGLLLVGFDGGAFFSMGDPYLLGAIGAVVIGGTVISGGRWSVAGTMSGALFLTLLVTVMEISKLAIGFEDLAEGVVIVGVVVAASVVRKSSTGSGAEGA